MPRRHRIDCPHERRPGMAVCLHCLHAARMAARERRQRAIIRFSLWTLGIVVVGAVGAEVTGNAVRHSAPPRAARPASRRVAMALPRRDSVWQAVAMPALQQGIADTTRLAAHDTALATAAVQRATLAPSKVDSSSSKPVASPLRTVLPAGRTDLADSLFAERHGDTVVVHFDTSPLRTRRADKFERIVRETLRSVYGPAADSALATVPDGRLVAPNELLTVLPAKGVHLAISAGGHITLWPETRPGRDGPLVVAFRTIVER